MPTADEDFSVSIIIAAAIILIAACVWPGFAKIRIGTLAGFWASQKTGQIYEIHVENDKKISVFSGGGLYATGRPWMVRGIKLHGANGQTRTASVEMNNRQIRFGDDVWLFQGIKMKFGVGAPTAASAAALCGVGICI